MEGRGHKAGVSRLYPEFENIFEALRQGIHRYDSVAEFEAFLSARLPREVDELGIRKIVGLLFNASVVGVRLGGSGQPRFRCEDSDLILPAAGAV